MFTRKGRSSTSKEQASPRGTTRSGRVLTIVAAGAAAAAVLAVGVYLAAGSVSPSSSALVSVIVRDDPAAAGSEQLVASLGGKVTQDLAIINGYAAVVPQKAVDALRKADGVASVTLNKAVHLSTDSSTDPNGPGWKYSTNYATMNEVTKLVGAQGMWTGGITGKGVGVALIDSGTVPVEGLIGQVIDGPDLSLESQLTERAGLDTFGHGTHLAGIIAGRDAAATTAKTMVLPANFVGVAPGAKVISIKVAASDGSTDITQVIAGINWADQHRNDAGLNIRVLNLSFGTDSTQDYTLDPLAYAVEVAWRHGITVVVAGGNNGSAGSLNDPAFDPYVIAVGAEDDNDTVKASDDIVPDWSARGNSTRGVDVVAPGKSILSLRDPGCWADVNFPTAAIESRFFLGSGTSQATAVVSGAAALLISQRPQLTPDQVKYLLKTTAKHLELADAAGQGAGLIDLGKASSAPVPKTGYAQNYPLATGLGSLEAARGSVHVSDDGVELAGEIDIFGQAWDGRSWSGRSWSGTCWEGDSWMGRSWSGTWSSTLWSGRSWSGRSWSDNIWDGRSWSGRSWSDDSWSGRSWSESGWLSVWAQ